MTAAAKAPVAAPLLSGFCEHSGFHEMCQRNPWCACTCHIPASAGDVNAVPCAAAAKDPPHEDGHLSPSGVPASPALLTLAADVNALSHQVAAALDGLAEIEALDALGQVRTARQALAQVEAVLERHAAKVMTGNVIEWPGGVAERRFGKDRKEWQHDELVRQVVNLIAADVATDKASGELDEMLAALVQDAVARFAETHRPEWRVTVLKKMGVDPDEFCHAVPGRVTVAITQATA